MPVLAHALRDRHGTTAIEFAIVGPIFLLMLIGTLYMCMMLFLTGSLYFAVQDGARCASVRTSTCSDGDSTVAYTESRYFGPLSPAFTYESKACGNSVTGTIDFDFNLGLTHLTAPISTTACFP